MDALQNFLQNLRPGGASDIPKSKLDQSVANDSDPESIDSPKGDVPKEKLKTNINPVKNEKTARNRMVKQTADVHDESSEFEEIKMASDPVVEETIVPDIKKPSPKPRQNIRNPVQSDEEEIKEIWRKLEIGEDGYLTLPELEKMCNYLEMNEMDKKDIQTLFGVIDTDKDDRVSIAEFSLGLKSHGQLRRAADELEDKARNNKRPHFESNRWSGLPVGNLFGLFSELNPNNTGFCEAGKIMEYWATGEICNGTEVLEYLNFTLQTPVNLLELSVSLEKEMLHADLDAITLSGILTYQKELHYNRAIIDELTGENMELKKEISTLDCENSQLRSRMTELQEINILQEEELDAVADLHRKMELELELLRDTKLIFNQTMTKNDRDELYELKKKFEQHFEASNNNSVRRHSQKENVNGQRVDSSRLDKGSCQSERKVRELQRKLQLKLDEVHYLKEQMDNLKSHRQDKESESSSLKRTELEKSIAVYMKKSDEYRDENEKLRNRIQSLESKIDIAINREKAYRVKLETTEKEVEKTQILEENLVELNNTLSETTKRYEMKLDKYSKENKQLQLENEGLVKSYHNLEAQFESMKAETKQENESLKKKNRQIENHKNEIANCYETLMAEREDSKMDKILIDKLEMANDRLSKALKDAVQKMDTISKQTYDSDKTTLNENIKLHKENMILEDEVSQLNRRLASIELYQQKDSNADIQNLQRQIKEKDKRIDELEEDVHKKNTDIRSDRFGSAKKIEQLQFKYEELTKKHQLQLEQVDKTDSLLKELYEENAKLVKSLQRSDALKEQNEMKIIHLEEKIKTLQHILNRNT